jgi:hypothetical protein
MKMKQQVQAGAQFGQLTLLEEIGVSSKHKKPYWMVQCVCGVKKVIRLESMKKGSSTSCGCMRKNKAKPREVVEIRDRTLVRRIHELAKQAETTPILWVEELLADWIQEHRSNKIQFDPDRHTARRDIDEWAHFEDVYDSSDVREVLL